MIFASTEVIKCLSVLQGQSITNTSIVSQWAATEALRHAQAITDEIRQMMQKRRDCFVETFNQLFPVKIFAPKSSLYCFVKLSDLGVSERNADEYSIELIEKANVALTPGSSFGEVDYVRFSFGISETDIREGLTVLRSYIYAK